MVGMKLFGPSKAQRDREALEHLGRCWVDGLAKGIREGEARVAARPEGVSEEDWRRQGLDEVMAELNANPLHQRMVTAAQMMLGAEDEA